MKKQQRDSSRERIDRLLVQREIAESRRRAQALVRAALVSVDGCTVEKPATLVRTDAELRLHGSDCPYVSRGGLKLEAALEGFGIDVSGLAALDVGASTGGFSDCLMRHGARKVYAIDSGSNQLAPALRGDPRIVNLEKTNPRRIPPGKIPEKIDVACGDVSFFSVEKVIPSVVAFLKPDADILVLLN